MFLVSLPVKRNYFSTYILGQPFAWYLYRGSATHISNNYFIIPSLQRRKNFSTSSQIYGVSWKISRRLLPNIGGLGGMLVLTNHKCTTDQDTPTVRTVKKQRNLFRTTLRLLLHTAVTIDFATLFMWICGIKLLLRFSLKYARRYLMRMALLVLQHIISTLLWIISALLKWIVDIIYMAQ